MISLTVTIIAFAAVFFAPLFMAGVELVRKRDAAALPLTPEYVREPRFFARSFREKIGRLADAPAGTPAGHVLSRVDDDVHVVDELPYQARTTDTRVLVVRGSADYPKDVVMRDHYVVGNASGGERLRARTILVEGDATLGPGLRVRRWIDAERSLTVRRGSGLGLSGSAGGPVTLEGDVRFTRVFGTPVRTAANGGAIPAAPHLPGAEIVDAESVHAADIVARGDLHIRPGARVHGSVKCHGRLVVGAGAVVDGSVTVRGNVHLGAGAQVTGHVFSEASIVLSHEARVALEGARKSVYAARRIVLGPEVTVWGWVFAERGGRTTGA
ncbi:MAG TPA: polymer-forming cytoskeletal protein [Candidatus Sulfotelmatobacter sp.]|nr:polymer-forming cytoskeletal protein [Candidatus Sulfotelmatobacter sp.]